MPRRPQDIREVDRFSDVSRRSPALANSAGNRDVDVAFERRTTFEKPLSGDENRFRRFIALLQLD
jgi:hypothetical protein